MYINICILDGLGSTALNARRWINKIKEFPLVLGREFCGSVKEMGDTVRSEIQIGDKVWGVIPPHQSGSHAEYIIIEDKYVII